MPDASPIPFWSATGPETDFPALAGEVSVDVAIVGGGMVGLSAALLLLQSGRSVAVVEADRIGRGVTGGTTGKITSQHGLIYDRLIHDVGEDRALLYASSNQQGLERIASWVQEFAIDCDFARKANFIFTREPDQVEALRREAEAACRLGLPAAFTERVPIPIAAEAAVRFDGQAQFHAVKYLVALGRQIVAQGGRIFERSRVLSVEEGAPCTVSTERGAVRAGEVIVASHLPVIPQGQFFAKAYPRAHQGLAARVPPSAVPDGMFITSDQPSVSVRAHSGDDGPWLILQGPPFKPGEDADTEQGYRDLEAFARAHFPIQDITHRWFNEDYEPADGVPFIGRASFRSEHLYVATGFNAWGLTTGMVAAMLIADLILGRGNPWLDVYDATRLRAIGSSEFVRENVAVGRLWLKGKFVDGEDIDPADLAAGEAAVLSRDGGKVAAYRDEGGTLHAVSAVCTHLGCTVGWNPAEKTWDCACHGSRFTCDGAILHGPAVTPLEPKPLNAETS